MKKRAFSIVIMALASVLTLLLCVGTGSVNVPLPETAAVIWDAITGRTPSGSNASIILSIRLPRAICTFLVGASLSVCGGAMQGLLKNPLADGSTLGVASGAALGAALCICFGLTVPGLPGGTAVMAVVFAFLSLIIILVLSGVIDKSFSNSTIILIGIIYTMFVSGALSIIVAFSGDKLRSVTFWTMGSLSGCGYGDAALLAVTLLVCSAVILRNCVELNAFSVSESNARHIGVDVRSVKLQIMIASSVLIGVCVSVSGNIAFVGLVTPHMLRFILGADHRRLLPGCIFGGGIFLLLCDLAARCIISPAELPIGVVTSIIGAVLFVVIFLRSRRCGG